MLARPRQSHAGGTALVVVLAATLTATLSGAAVAPARAGEVTAAASDTVVTPSSLHFGELEPGATAVRTATLTTSPRDRAAFVRAVVTGAGTLVDHLTTQVEACTVPWVADTCSAGGVVLVAGPVGDGVDTVLDVPVARAGVAHLRVTLALDAAAPAGGASTVSYELHLVALDEVAPPGPVGPPGPLPTTGMEAAAIGAAALALLALGVSLRTWVRGRRRAGAGRWVS